MQIFNLADDISSLAFLGESKVQYVFSGIAKNIFWLGGKNIFWLYEGKIFSGFAEKNIFWIDRKFFRLDRKKIFSGLAENIFWLGGKYFLLGGKTNIFWLGGKIFSGLAKKNLAWRKFLFGLGRIFSGLAENIFPFPVEDLVILAWNSNILREIVEG